MKGCSLMIDIYYILSDW